MTVTVTNTVTDRHGHVLAGPFASNARLMVNLIISS